MAYGRALHEALHRLNVPPTERIIGVGNRVYVNKVTIHIAKCNLQPVFKKPTNLLALSPPAPQVASGCRVLGLRRRLFKRTRGDTR